jgi:hypothetical protein
MTYKYIIKNVKVNLDKHPENMERFLCEILKSRPDMILSWKIKSKSIDARKKDKEGIYLVYSSDCRQNPRNTPRIFLCFRP